MAAPRERERLRWGREGIEREGDPREWESGCVCSNMRRGERVRLESNCERRKKRGGNVRKKK